MLPFLATCLRVDPAVKMTLGEIVYCAGEATFGSIQLASIVFFIAVAYLMWKMNIPIEVTIPACVLLLFALGSATYAIIPTFTNLLWLLIFGIAVLFVLMILYFARK